MDNKPIVLLVEDRLEDKNAILWAFEDTGRFEGDDYKMLHAKNSDQALELLTGVKPGHIIMDINLQGSVINNGLDLIPVLKEHNGFKVTVLTTSPAPADVQKAVDVGALAVMEKLTGDLFANLLDVYWKVFVDNNYCPRNLAMGPDAMFLYMHHDYIEPAE